MAKTIVGSRLVFRRMDPALAHTQEMASKHLVPYKHYTVERVNVRSFHTYVYLAELPGMPFNRAFFDEA